MLNDEHDVFGRWFMDHPHIRFGFLTPSGPIEDFAFYDFQELNGTSVLRGHELAQDIAKDEHLLRFCINLVGRHELDATRSGQGLAGAFDAIRSKNPARSASLAPCPSSGASPNCETRNGPALRDLFTTRHSVDGLTPLLVGMQLVRSVLKRCLSNDHRRTTGFGLEARSTDSDDDCPIFSGRGARWSWTPLNEVVIMVAKQFRACECRLVCIGSRTRSRPDSREPVAERIISVARAKVNHLKMVWLMPTTGSTVSQT